jgi:hypothetical protein
MKWFLRLALVFLSLSLVSTDEADCDNVACQAYVTFFPLWHTTNLRYLSALNSPPFNYNSFGARVSSLPLPPPNLPQLTTCNASLCSGIPTLPLNPAPINAPYTGFVYGAITWDLGDGPNGGLIRLLLPSSNNANGAVIRYASIVFYDAYTNIVKEFNTFDQSPPTSNTFFCLSQVANHPSCIPPAVPPTVIKVQAPKRGYAIIRAFSTGQPAPPSPYPQCGVDGCAYILQSLQGFSNLAASSNIQNDKTKYTPYMNADACPYVYGQPPCGDGGNTDAFWDAVCLALADNPLTGAEAAYVDNTFGSLGITSTGCDNLQYKKLKNGLSQGDHYIYLNRGTGITTATSGAWSMLPFDGSWDVVDLQSALYRAVSSQRLQYMNSDHAAVYWTAFTDSDNSPLTGKNSRTYKIGWNSDSAIVTSRGFWSVHLYDETSYLFNPSDDQKQYAITGAGTVPSGEIHVANTCVNSNCIRSPPTGNFNLMLRAYGYLPTVSAGGDYVFPTIQRCEPNDPCN